MKYKIVIVLLIIAVSWVIGRHNAATGVRTEPSAVPPEQAAGPAEIPVSYRLSPGARVEVRGINGSVRVETTDSDGAEVSVVQSARDPRDLEGSLIRIEHTPDSLVVRREQRGGRWWRFWGGGGVSQQVTLKIRRRAELCIRGVNGPVTAGSVEGALSLKGANGRVEVAQPDCAA